MKLFLILKNVATHRVEKEIKFNKWNAFIIMKTVNEDQRSPPIIPF